MTPQLESQIRQWCSDPYESQGWTTVERCLEMAQLILDMRPFTVVEIGVFGGRTFISQAMALKQNRKDHGIIGTIYGIDPWKKEAALEGENQANKDWWDKNVDLNDVHQKCVDAIWKYQLDDHAVPMRAASQNCYNIFREVDIIFIDGNHSEIASCRDVHLYLPRVRVGGYVWSDDTDWATTKQMQRMIEAYCEVIKDAGKYKLYKKVRGIPVDTTA